MTRELSRFATLAATERTQDEKELTLSEQTETPILDLVTAMTAASLETTTLDADTAMLVRIAALVAVDAPPASYLMNLGVASELGIGEDDVRGVLAAIAPIVGTPKVVAATGNILRALGLALEMAELDGGDD
jgi:alkylhydroperoxidase/carboxymuconolactone decarboxylase family protein YurZ